MTIAERVDEIRATIDLFPRCVKCNGDLTGERLTNLVQVVGRFNRLMHHECPREVNHAAD